MKHWTIQIDWFVDDSRILGAQGSFNVEPGDSAIECAALIANAVGAMGEPAERLLHGEGKEWDKRITMLTLHSGNRRRSISIEQPSGWSDQEAHRWATQLMEWILAAPTTELLEA
jgi:hypothetical protein